MKKNANIKIVVDGELMDEVKSKDIYEDFVKKETKDGTYYTIDFPITKKNWKIKDNGLLYINRFFALDLSGSLDYQRNVYKTGDLVIDMKNEIVYKNGVILKLYPRSFRILKLFMESPHGRISRKSLVTIMEMENGKIVQENTLNQHMNRLKKALGKYEGNEYFHCVYRFGYIWTFPVESE